jgi:hypothetical protein
MSHQDHQRPVLGEWEGGLEPEGEQEQMQQHPVQEKGLNSELGRTKYGEHVAAGIG